MSQYSDLILGEAGLVSYWRLGELTGTSIADSKGTDTGTAVNTPTLGVAGVNPDDANAAITFTAGSLHHITLGATGLGFGNGPYSFEAWFKTTAAGANFAILDAESLSGGAGDIGFGLGNLANGKVSVTDGANRIISSAAAPLYNDGKWHHVVITKIVAGNVWKMYVDGNDVTTADTFPTQATTSGVGANGRIGVAYNAGTQRWFFTGTLDEVAVYNVALSQAQAYTHFTAGVQSMSAYVPVINTRQGPRPLRRMKHRAWTRFGNGDVAAATNAAAEVASGTGQAFNASISLAPTGGLASGTGAANSPTPSVAPNAGNAAGTGAAFGATVSIAPHGGLASGTGAANNPSASIAPNAGAATGTGTAFSPTPSVAPNAGNAAGTGTAFGPSKSVAPSINAATGTGAALNPTPSVAPNAGNAAGTGTAFNPGKTVAVNGGFASGTGQAFNATISTSSATNAPAQLASGTGTAYGATVSIATSGGLASGTGISLGAALALAISAQNAAGTGAAFEATAGQAAVVTGGAPPLISAAVYPGSVGGARRHIPRVSVSHPKPEP